MKLLSLLLVTSLIGQPLFAQMPGYLGSAQGNSMYNLTGSPVNGAYMGQQYAGMGTGQSMIGNCPYPQGVYVDPTDKDEGVIEAKANLSQIDEDYKNAREDKLAADRALRAARDDLKHALSDNYSVDTFISTMKSCQGFINANSSVSDHNEFAKNLSTSSMNKDAKVECWVASSYGQAAGNDAKTNFDASALCLAADQDLVWKSPATVTSVVTAQPAAAPSTPARRQRVADGASTKPPKDAPRRQQDFGTAATGGSLGPSPQSIITTDTSSPEVLHPLHGGKNTDDKLDSCRSSASALANALRDKEAAEAKLKKAMEDRKRLQREVIEAKREAKRNQALDDEMAAERQTSKTTGVVCAQCAAANPGISKTALIAGALVIGGLGWYGIHSNNAYNNRITQLGFIGSNQNSFANNAGSISTALSAGGPLVAYGLGAGQSGYGQGAGVGSYGYPMMANGLYGTTGGGFTQGGIGCGQTANGSQMIPNGIMMANGQPYYPGGAYMPGMTNYGIPGQGQNALLMQQQGMLQNQLADEQRSLYLAQATANAGYTAFNQNMGLAGQYLQSSGQIGLGGLGGGGYGLSGGGYGQSTYGLNSMLGNTFASPFARQGCGAGANPFATTSFSICASGSSYGGGYAPTLSNANYSPYNTGGNYNLSTGATFIR